MRSFILILILLITFSITALGVGCTVVPLNLEEPADVARLYQRRCGGCHALIAPSEYPMDDWPLWLDEFGPRSGLTAYERGYLEPWLMARAKDGPLRRGRPAPAGVLAGGE